MPWSTARPGGAGYVNPKYRTPEHRAKVAQYKRQQAAGKAHCWRCGRWLPPGAPLHAGHDDTGTTYMGPECPPCNRSDAARRARARQNTSPLRW